jgi:HAD superfamily phosphoserine phosphatase-like hydrolase
MNPLEPLRSELETPSTDLETLIIAADLEGTLTKGETWRGLKAYLEAHGRKRDYDGFIRRHLLDYLGASVGVIPKRRFQTRWITDFPQLFGGATLKEFHAIAAWVTERELLPKLRRAPINELEAAKRGGARVILVSGTYQPVLEMFAHRFGFEAIGTPLELVNGHLTGRLAGPVNVGAVKCSSLRALIGQRSLTRAYGDTMPDVPMLISASQAVIVTGNDPALERFATQRGWRRLE